MMTSPDEWIQNVAPHSYYDPGWGGTKPMLAEIGAEKFETAREYTQKGIIFVIPIAAQLNAFYDSARAEFEQKCWQFQEGSVHFREARDGSRWMENHYIKSIVYDVSRNINQRCRMLPKETNRDSGGWVDSRTLIDWCVPKNQDGARQYHA